MMLHKYLSILFLLLGSLSTVVGQNDVDQSQLIDKVVAVVGENIVLYSEIEDQIDQMTLSDVPVTANSRCEILEDLMYQKLFLNQSKEDSLVVSDEQIEQELNRRLRYFISQIGSEEELVKFYGKTLDEIREDFKDEVREILLIQQMQQRVMSSANVSPLEVKEFYKGIPKDSLPYINTEVELAHIVKKSPISKNEEERIIARLKDFKARVNAGEDFGTLAYLYSLDPGSAEKNGELGFLGRNELVPEFANAANGLQKGQMSDIVKTQFGYHLLQMIDRRGEQINVRHILLIPQVSPEDLLQAKKFLDSLYVQIQENDTLTFARAAAKFSDDPDTKMNGGRLINPMSGTTKFDVDELGQIDRSLMFAVQKLKKGEMTQPVLFQANDGKRSYRILKLLTLTEPHVANLQTDYSRLQQAAKRLKENALLEKWIREHKDNAYVWVDPAFEGCAFETKWKLAQR